MPQDRTLEWNDVILAIDLGSTAFKAGVFDTDTRCVGSGTGPLEYIYGHEGEVELEPAVVEGAFRQAVSGALGSSGTDRNSLSACAITSQAQTYTVVDASGKARFPFVSWLDVRADGARETLAEMPELSDFASHASFPDVLAGLQVALLRHLHDTQPGFVRQDDRILLLPSYLLGRISGSTCIDENLAAMSGLYSMSTRSWWDTAMAACGISAGHLSDVVPVGSAAARTDERADAFGLPAGLPIVLAGNDQTSGAFGAGLSEGGPVLITLGTCQVAYRCVGSFAGSDRSTVCGPYPGGLYYEMVADEYGGGLINWARNVISGCRSDEAFFDRAAEAGPGCNNLVFSVGEGGKPHAWDNIELKHTAGDLARSIVECLATRMKEMVERLCGDPSGMSFLLAGGGSRSSLWVEILSESLGRDLQLTEADPLLGAAMMAQRTLDGAGSLGKS